MSLLNCLTERRVPLTLWPDPGGGWSLRQGHEGDEGVVHGGGGEETAHVGMCPPQVVADDFTAPQVLDLKAQLPVALVRLEERRVCVVTQVL